MRRSSRIYLMLIKCSVIILRGEDMIVTGHLVELGGNMVVTLFRARAGNLQGLMEVHSHESSSIKLIKTSRGSLARAGSVITKTHLARASRIHLAGEGPSIETVEATITNSIATRINMRTRRGVRIPTSKKTFSIRALRSSSAKCKKTFKEWSKRLSASMSKNSSFANSIESDTASMATIRLTLHLKIGMQSKKSTHSAQ